MKTSYYKSSSIYLVVLIVLLLTVLCSSYSIAFVFQFKSYNNDGYTFKQVLAGLAAELIRTIVSCRLYAATPQKGSSIKHGIYYGLLYSALVGSLYLFVGAFYFQVKHPIQFVLVDAFVLVMQGISSGIAFYYCFRRPKTKVAKRIQLEWSTNNFSKQ